MSEASLKTTKAKLEAELSANKPPILLQPQKIDAEKIKHMAHLSRIGISQLEAEQYAGQMASILAYMTILEEVNTDGVEMTMQVTNLKNVTRLDEIEVYADPEELLATSMLPKIGGQLAVKSVIKED